jgi:hypothetical protein
VIEYGPEGAVSHRVDTMRRMVYVRIRKNLAPTDLVQFYSSIFSSDAYQPGFNFLVDRRGVPSPTADAIRLVVAYLRDHVSQTGACRMAVVTDEDVPRSAWRGAEMLADHYTSVELRVFDDHEAAELWASGQQETPEPDHPA